MKKLTLALLGAFLTLSAQAVELPLIEKFVCSVGVSGKVIKVYSAMNSNSAAILYGREDQNTLAIPSDNMLLVDAKLSTRISGNKILLSVTHEKMNIRATLDGSISLIRGNNNFEANVDGLKAYCSLVNSIL